MLNQAHQNILRILRETGAGVLEEDDYADFKNFIARWEEPFLEKTCMTIEFVVREHFPELCSTNTLEFFCLLYTTKGPKMQRLLSDNQFGRVKQFLESMIFAPAGLTPREYFKIKRDYKTSHLRPLFIDGQPGVIIIIGGLATTIV
ncbi:MAG: hypothetical protein ACYDBT_09890 [Desulfobulbaceae bacterium]